MDAYHILIVRKFEEKMNSSLEKQRKNNLQKKQQIYVIYGGSISKTFVMKDFFRKENVPHKEFLENLGLLIVKKNLPIQFVENI
jgi:hypothetical protein